MMENMAQEIFGLVIREKKKKVKKCSQQPQFFFRKDMTNVKNRK